MAPFGYFSLACGSTRSALRLLAAAHLAMWPAACTEAAQEQRALPRISLRLRDDGSGERDFVEAPSEDSTKPSRVRVFHGTNVVVKGPPWLPNRTDFDWRTSLVARDFQDLRSAGVNLIRFGVMWGGAEPERGQYSESYYKELRGIIEDAAKYGIYVLLDMHQDMLSEYFCGEGVPSWAVEHPNDKDMMYPFPLGEPLQDHSRFPSYQECIKLRAKWAFGQAESQVTYAAALNYDRLYTDVDGLLQAWGAFWRKTAMEVAGLSNLLGFELMNEPFAGNFFKNLFLAVPAIADLERLQPAYDTLARYIREVDSETLIFFASVTWEDSPLGMGFQHAPGGMDEAHRSVLAYHFYAPPQELGKFQDYFARKRSDAVKLGTGLMMTESCCHEFLEAAEKLAAMGQSWIQWEWKEWCRVPAKDDPGFGNCITGQGAGPWQDQVYNKTWVERSFGPYAPAVAGKLFGSTWDGAARRFELRFTPDRHSNASTEVFVNPALSFPKGFDVRVRPDVLDFWQEQGALQIRFRLARDAMVPAEPVVVTLSGRVTVTESATSPLKLLV